jgi:transcriptional regulator with XRE-family HTH domain
MTTSGAQAHRDYARWRTRQIAYGRWKPWADAAPVREHLRQLRATGASVEAIARTAGVSPMTIYRLQRNNSSNGQPVLNRIRTAQAERLLAVTPATFRSARRDATGARRRLQALVAMGHPAVSLARHLGVPACRTWNIIRGTTATVTPEMHTAVRELFERLWDLCPPERTAAERRAVTSARARAATHGWPTPMGLDDDHIDDPAYRPRTTWRPATGTGVTTPAVQTVHNPGLSRVPSIRHDMEAAS